MLVVDFLAFALDVHHERLVCNPFCRGRLIVADGHSRVIFDCPLLIVIEGVSFLCPALLLIVCLAPAEDKVRHATRKGPVIIYKRVAGTVADAC